MSLTAKTQGLPNEPAYRPDIDGLRALAVTSVVLSHASEHLLPGGFIGVDVFFVISGYLITSILLRDLERRSLSLTRFYSRRIRRLFPSLITVLTATLALGWWLLFEPEFATLGSHVLASTLFSENFLLWGESGYFDASSTLKPLLHLWSLAIEEQFYLLWPLLLLAAHRWRIRLGWMLVILAAASFAWNLRDVQQHPTAAYYSPLGRAWELLVGAGLAFVESHRPRVHQCAQELMGAAGLLMLAAALMIERPAPGFPGWRAGLPAWGAALVLAAGAGSWVNRRLLSARPFAVLGRISYPFYLWHWPLLSFVHIVDGQLTRRTAVACVVVAFLLAALTYRFIEQPWRQRDISWRGSLALLGALLLAAALGTLAQQGRLPPRLHHFAEPTATDWDFLQASRSAADPPGIYRLAPERPRAVLFIGDSHLAHYASRLDRAVGANPQAPGAVLAIGGGCIPVEGVHTDDPERQACWALRRQAYAMASEPRFQTIVIGAAWNWYFFVSDYTLDASGQRLPLTRLEARQLALGRLGDHIRALTQAGRRVVLLLDNPYSHALKPNFREIRLGLSSERLESLRTVEVDARQVELRHQLLELARQTGADVIDPFGALCSGNSCRVTDEAGMPIYRDDGHFNPAWVTEHATFIDAALRP